MKVVETLGRECPGTVEEDGVVAALLPDMSDPGGFCKKRPLGVREMEEGGGRAEIALSEAYGGFKETASLVKLNKGGVEESTL